MSGYHTVKLCFSVFVVCSDFGYTLDGGDNCKKESWFDDGYIAPTCNEGKNFSQSQGSVCVFCVCVLCVCVCCKCVCICECVALICVCLAHMCVCVCVASVCECVLCVCVHVWIPFLVGV